MRKGIIILAVLLVLVVALPVFAADSDADGINDIYQQMLQLRKQLVDKYVGSGNLSPEEGQIMKDRLDDMEQYRQENPEAFDQMIQGCGSMMGGNGMTGGYGMMGGYGPQGTGVGGYGMMGGFGRQL